MQDERNPVKDLSESMALPGGTAIPSNRGRVVFCDGLYYAQLPLSEDGKLITVALHGVTTEGEASQALTALSPLSQSVDAPHHQPGVYHF